jgi:hypothetical protein
MAEETSTRTALRRKICKELRMPFFRRVGTSSTVAASSTTSSIIDTKLTQPEGTWSGSWFFNVSTGEVSLIRSFTANDDTLRIEKPCASSPVGNTYEIHSIWNADEVHDAINEAIRLGRRTFPQTITDETIVLQEEVLTYAISGLTNLPWVISKIWVEQRSNCERGNVVSAAATTVTLPSMPTGVSSLWRISIFGGKGAGQTRTCGTPTVNTFSVTAWTTIPDTTSKYVLYDASEEIISWKPFNNFHLDTEEFPDTLYMNKLHQSFYGMRLRLEMLSVSQELTTEASTTNLPAEYIKAKSCAILHGQALSNTKADKDMHYAEYKRYGDESDAYVVRNAMHTPGVRFRSPITDHTYGNDNNNPLSWET